MRRTIREHFRDFIAIGVLIVIGLATTGIILSQQQQPYPSWIPFLGDERFTLKAELSTAQAVVPGQGQTVNIAGVKAGDLSEVELVDGHAVVTMLVEEQYASLIREDASVLLRPRTGLQDMTLELDPGTPDSPPIEEDATILLDQTKPNVQPDEVLSALDYDTQTYLQLLIGGGAEGIGGRGKELSATLRRFEPLGRYLAQIGDGLSERRRSISRAITSFKLLMEALGRSDTRLADFVTSSDDVLGSFADQEASIRAALQELPSALRATRQALIAGDSLSAELGPASTALIPAAQAFAPAQEAGQEFFEQTTEPIEDQIRPFAREVQPTVRHLKQAAGPLAGTVNGLAGSLSELNTLTNALAYNPPGAEEGYLYWTAWLNHNTNNIFLTQDANGPLRRGIVIQSCSTAQLAEGFAASRPFIDTLQRITNVPQSETICPAAPGGFVFKDAVADAESAQLDAAAADDADRTAPAEAPEATISTEPAGEGP